MKKVRVSQISTLIFGQNLAKSRTQLLFLVLFYIQVGPFCPTFEFGALFVAVFVDNYVVWVRGRVWKRISFSTFLLSKQQVSWGENWQKWKTNWFPHSIPPIRHETTDVREKTSSANRKTEFLGVQSNLQFNFNYRRENKRLEVDFLWKAV